MKVFSGIVTHDATASATIFVMAENAEEAAEKIIEAAQNGAGNFEWNDGNSIDEYYFGGGQNDIEEIGEIEEINSLEDWVSSKPGTLVYWPTNGDEPYTRKALEELCYNTSEWAYKLYRHCVDSGGAYHPTTFIDEDGCVENLLFGDEGNLMKLKRLLAEADLVTVDDSPYLPCSSVVLPANNMQDLAFQWEAGGLEYESAFSVEDIAQGYWNDDAFYLKGDDAFEFENVICLYKLAKLS